MDATGKNAMLSSSADITLDLSSLFVYMFIISDWIFWYVTFCVFFLSILFLRSMFLYSNQSFNGCLINSICWFWYICIYFFYICVLSKKLHFVINTHTICNQSLAQFQTGSRIVCVVWLLSTTYSPIVYWYELIIYLKFA